MNLTESQALEESNGSVMLGEGACLESNPDGQARPSIDPSGMTKLPDCSQEENAELQDRKAPPKPTLYNLVKVAAQMPQEAGEKKIKDFLAKGEDINAVNSKGSSGLHAALYLKRWDLAKFLLGLGADPRQKNPAGDSLERALARTDKEVAKDILEPTHPELLDELEEKSAGANSSRGKKKDRARQGRSERKASMETREASAPRPEKTFGPKELNWNQEEFDKSSGLMVIDPRNGEMTEHGALWEIALERALADNEEGFKEIVSQTGWAHGFDPDGQNMAWRLAQANKTWALSLWADSSKDAKALDIQNREGATALGLACIAENTNALRSLLSAGADTNAVDRMGNGPLHLAAQRGLDDTVERLVSFGAKAHWRNKEGLTPKQIAERAGHAVCSELLAAAEEEALMGGQEQAQSQVSHAGNGAGKRKSNGKKGKRRNGNGSHGGRGRKPQDPWMSARKDKELRDADDCFINMGVTSSSLSTKPRKEPVIIVKKSKLAGLAK